jgi:hypothetical protein
LYGCYVLSDFLLTYVYRTSFPSADLWIHLPVGQDNLKASFELFLFYNTTYWGVWFF